MRASPSCEESGPGRAADCKATNEANTLGGQDVLSPRAAARDQLALERVVLGEKEVFTGVRVKPEPLCSLLVS